MKNEIEIFNKIRMEALGKLQNSASNNSDLLKDLIAWNLSVLDYASDQASALDPLTVDLVEVKDSLDIEDSLLLNEFIDTSASLVEMFNSEEFSNSSLLLETIDFYKNHQII